MKYVVEILRFYLVGQSISIEFGVLQVNIISLGKSDCMFSTAIPKLFQALSIYLIYFTLTHMRQNAMILVRHKRRGNLILRL